MIASNPRDRGHMITKKMLLIIALSLTITFYACEEEKMNTNTNTKTTIDDVKPANWENLAQKKIFFGHQSVGNNIISGMKDLMQKNPNIKLRILETENPSDFASGIFAHHGIGQNGAPESKIKDFVRIMDQGIGGKADIAFFKFCYIDFNTHTNVQQLFNNYKNTMSILKEKYPQTVFMHCTVPLVIKTKTSPISMIKKILGRDDRMQNIARNDFNELMRKEYGEKAHIFDIAEIESTYPDGSRETFVKNGNTYYALVLAYTDDGGHLNELGRKKVAEKLLMLLINL